MASTRVLVVSDTHLSRRTPEALANWDAVVDHAHQGSYDLCIHVGDVTADGADRDDDLVLARHQLARLPIPASVVPGNHDVGDNPRPGTSSPASPAPPAHGTGRPTDDGEPLVTHRRLERYRAALGPDRWTVDVPGWRIVGLNAQLAGSGLADEDEQWLWLADRLRNRPTASGHVALVVHKPLVPPPRRPTDDTPPRYLPPAAATRLLEAAGAVPIDVVVSGHTHQFSNHTHQGVAHLWAPTTWAVIPDRYQPVLGDKVCGVVELSLGDDGGHQARLHQPADLKQHTLIDTIDNPYGHV